ncbi:MAG: molybdenum ABC transporter ATP-binding protein [Rhodospirillaceae bacterium]|nr:molybdenum ABC transporter ATP-binding protein [Rhodospirillaceae bacterium]
MSLEVRLSHAFPGFTLEVDFAAPDGVTALFGRSGSGKTTVINAVAGLLRPAQGRVAVNGTVLLDTARGMVHPPHRRRIGYVFQEGRLFPHLSVRQNLAFGQWFGPRDGAAVETDRVVEMLGIGHLLSRRPGLLSGGEKQRVAIGRALLSSPRLLLMDEPLASLDEARKTEILPYLERLRDETRIPILYVSHAMAEVARLATTIVTLHEGRVGLSGPAGHVLADPRVVPEIGVREAGAAIEARVVSHDAVGGVTELAISAGRLVLPHIDAPPGSTVRVRIHAHEVILATEKPSAISALNILPATVTSLSGGDGPGVAVGLLAGEDPMLAHITKRSATALGLAPGTPCFAIVKSVAVARRDIGSFETRHA